MKLILMLSLLLPLYAFQGEPQKLCIHCKHFTKDFFNSNTFGKCKSFPKETDSNYYLVDGKPNPQIDLYYCSTARMSDDMCGTEGYFFEKKK
jgi:hypothetical protein